MKRLILIYLYGFFTFLSLCFLVFLLITRESKAEPETVIIQEKTKIPYTALGEYTLTWYCISGTTASGNKTNHNLTIAGDLNKLKFNDVVYIEKLGGAYVMHDTGRLVKGNRIDIYTNDCQQAIKNGVQKSNVYLIGE